MKVLPTARPDADRTAALVVIIFLGMVAFAFLRMVIGLFCECLARPMFLGL
mgnify:CR=1 FL=1